jgi:DNA-binding transcriptional LysR family regulator
MLSLKHIAFMAVAKEMSFTKASKTLFISQPAISKHIKDLEGHYQCRLFERSANGIMLTAAGKILYQHLLVAESLERKMMLDVGAAAASNQLAGELKLGACTTVALYIIPPVLSAFRKKNPLIKISLLNRNSETVLRALLEHEIDLGIIEGKHKMPKVSCRHFFTDEVIPVCASHSSFAKKKQLSLDNLKALPIALREKGSGTLAALAQALQKKGIPLSQLNICMRLSGTEALKNFILADGCIGFLPKKAVAKELQNGDLTKLSMTGLAIARQFWFIHRQGDGHGGLLNGFVKLALDYYNKKL